MKIKAPSQMEKKLCVNCGREFTRKRFPSGFLESSLRWKQRKACRRNCYGPDSLFENKIHYEFGEAWISLPGNLWARCDIADVSFLMASVTHWFATTVDGKTYARGWSQTLKRHVRMHKLLMPESPKLDHRNGNGLDNRRGNLRPATSTQNAWNARKMRGGSSRFKGVTHFKRGDKWDARITINGRLVNLGRFKHEYNAAQAYNFVADEHFGEFALLNTI